MAFPARRSTQHRLGVGLGGAAALLAVALGAPGQVRADSASPLITLVDAAAQRLAVADPVAAFKWHARVAIEDPDRVQQQLAKLGDAARAAQVDPNYVTRLFGDQISATEAIEYSRFADWKFGSADVPAAPPDLSASRAEIDALNDKILSQITLNRSLLESASCAAQLDLARADTIRARQLDSLYQRALLTATRSYCPAGGQA
ncbi:Secreted chorismate mutase precursor [Mycobacterium marinum]|uniref:chorismate mutase n=1 Tax=Mycobacterium marinum TaxID=1781 RepID=UPI000E3C6171|nr:Secreted chorismate mutase precursor [Mycobacterium marinum]